MENYNYLEQVTTDAKEAILENMEYWIFYDREELEEVAHDKLWADDSVTGNGSSSYFCSTWKAEEALCHNWDLLAEACEEFGQDIGWVFKRGAEFCDVTIRCYLLGQSIAAALDEVEAEQKIAYTIPF